MYKGVAALIMVLVLSVLAQAGPPSAAILLAAAEKQARQNHKPVLVVFHASWCGWCKQLDKFLTDQETGPLMSANFVVVQIDVQERDDHKDLANPGGEALMTQWKGEGLPFMAILDGNGTELSDSNLVRGQATNIGFPSKPEEIAHFMTMLSSAPHLSPSQRAEIENWLKARSQ